MDLFEMLGGIRNPTPEQIKQQKLDETRARWKLMKLINDPDEIAYDLDPFDNRRE